MKIMINGIDLFYEKVGNGNPIILLHGNGENHYIFSSMVNIFKEHFTVYSIDSRNHGQSSKVKKLTYEDMAEDIYTLITTLNLNKPILYGFSDGGIIGLLVAINHPDNLSSLIISGVNISKDGIKNHWKYLYKLGYFFTKSPRIGLLIKDINITKDMLNQIKIPVYITAGDRDVVKLEHTLYI